MGRVSHLGVLMAARLIPSPIASAAPPGPMAHDLASIIPDARVGVSDKEGFDQTFTPPLAAPGMPARLYFLFQKPIKLDPRDYHDRDKCEAIYTQVGRGGGGGGSFVTSREGCP